MSSKPTKSAPGQDTQITPGPGAVTLPGHQPCLDTKHTPAPGSVALDGQAHHLRVEGSGLIHPTVNVKEAEERARTAAAVERERAEQEKRKIATQSSLARQAILDAIQELGFDPKSLKKGARAAVRKRLPQFTHDVFKHAWDDLLRDGLISRPA